MPHGKYNEKKYNKSVEGHYMAKGSQNRPFTQSTNWNQSAPGYASQDSQCATVGSTTKIARNQASTIGRRRNAGLKARG